uniref:Uncharacterized protein n=1 Tax=Lutzomyia longipalpis TaxID=7200 RepID=A0A1B0CWN8_LUTLO
MVQGYKSSSAKVHTERDTEAKRSGLQQSQQRLPNTRDHHQQQQTNNSTSNKLTKNLGVRKGSRTGNSGNHLEFQVLTLIEYVP